MSTVSGQFTPMTNAMTVDVEDYFQVAVFEKCIRREDWPRWPVRVEDNTRRVLELFQRHDVHATFFVLGWVAERFPSLVRDISAAGHEIASHGFGHERLTNISRSAFRDGIVRTKHLLEDLSGVVVAGYRAPSMPAAPRFAFLAEGSGLLEIPVTTARLWGRNWPCGGGGYFRLLPYTLFKSGLHRGYQQELRPGVFYFHPWEVDPQQPRVPGVTLKNRVRHYLNLTRTAPRIERLVRDFRFDRMDRVFLAPGHAAYPVVALDPQESCGQQGGIQHA
jgi:hypothetical protein